MKIKQLKEQKTLKKKKKKKKTKKTTNKKQLTNDWGRNVILVSMIFIDRLKEFKRIQK